MILSSSIIIGMETSEFRDDNSVHKLTPVSPRGRFMFMIIIRYEVPKLYTFHFENPENSRDFQEFLIGLHGSHLKLADHNNYLIFLMKFSSSEYEMCATELFAGWSRPWLDSFYLAHGSNYLLVSLGNTISKTSMS